VEGCASRVAPRVASRVAAGRVALEAALHADDLRYLSARCLEEFDLAYLAGAVRPLQPQPPKWRSCSSVSSGKAAHSDHRSHYLVTSCSILSGLSSAAGSQRPLLTVAHIVSQDDDSYADTVSVSANFTEFERRRDSWSPL